MELGRSRLLEHEPAGAVMEPALAEPPRRLHRGDARGAAQRRTRGQLDPNVDRTVAAPQRPLPPGAGDGQGAVREADLGGTGGGHVASSCRVARFYLDDRVIAIARRDDHVTDADIEQH
jgi:hypothetical protein